MSDKYFYYTPQVMDFIWSVLRMPDGTAICTFDNRTYEIQVKEIKGDGEK